MFDQRDLKQITQRHAESWHGREGCVLVESEPGLRAEPVALKFQTKAFPWDGREARLDLLVSRGRRAVHETFNALAQDECVTPVLSFSGLKWIGGASIRTVSIMQASARADNTYELDRTELASYGWMPALQGRVLSAFPAGLIEKVRDLGFLPDFLGRKNLILERSEGTRQLLVLEFMGGIHMEALRKLEQLSATPDMTERCAGALYHLACAYHLGVISAYPTAPRAGVFTSSDYMPGPDTGKFWRDMNTDYQRAGQHCEALSKWQLEELERCRKIFSPTFQPHPFDFVSGSTNANYGISEGVFGALRAKIEQLAPAFQRIIDANSGVGRTAQE